METKTNKTILKAVGLLGSILLTVFAGTFGLMSITALFMSAIDKDIVTVLISGVCAFLGWACWSVRRDTLI